MHAPAVSSDRASAQLSENTFPGCTAANPSHNGRENSFRAAASAPHSIAAAMSSNSAAHKRSWVLTSGSSGWSRSSRQCCAPLRYSFGVRMRSLPVFIRQNIGADAPWPGLSSSAARTLERHARYPADTGVADQHVCGLLIKRRCPLEAVIFLELQERPFCLRTRDAVEGAIVETNGMSRDQWYEAPLVPT